MGKDELPPAQRVVPVSNDRELQQAIAAARPGDHIVLADGRYQSRVRISKKGTCVAPIVLRARNVLGAHLAGGFELTPDSAFIWIYGVDLKDASSIVQGENHVLRRVRILPPFRSQGGSTGVAFKNGKNARLDYCELRMYATKEVKDRYGTVWARDSSYGAVRSVFRGGDWFTNLVIERCLLTGGPSGVPYSAPNSQFIEAQGPSGNNAKLRDTYDINWVMRSLYGNVPRDRTILDFKQRGMALERSHIISNNGQIQVRHGCCNAVKETRLEGTAITVSNAYNVVENTIAPSIKVLAGNAPWDKPISGGPHRQAYATRLSNTRGTLRIGHQFGSEFTYPALNTVVENHSGTITRGLERGTVIRSQSSVPIQEPPRLSPREVGPFAPWVGVTP